MSSRLALAAGGQGLDALKIIIARAPSHLSSAGRLLVEHGYNQREAVTGLMKAHGFTSVEVLDDLAGLPRVASGCGS